MIILSKLNFYGIDKILSTRTAAKEAEVTLAPRSAQVEITSIIFIIIPPKEPRQAVNGVLLPTTTLHAAQM
jgi:hypothetical protein